MLAAARLLIVYLLLVTAGVSSARRLTAHPCDPTVHGEGAHCPHHCQQPNLTTEDYCSRCPNTCPRYQERCLRPSARLLLRGSRATRQNCTGLPAAAPNAQPWPSRCSNSKPGAKCRARCKPVSSALRSESVTATCDPSGSGKWSVQPVGACLSPSAQSFTCQGTPPSVEGASWGSCDYTAAGSSCTSSKCLEGYEGTGYTSECLLTGQWAEPKLQSDSNGGCRKTDSAKPTVCQGPPAAVQNARWAAACSVDTMPGGSCTAVCQKGTKGAGYTSNCTAAGVWSLPAGSGCSTTTEPGKAMVETVCQGQPPTVEGVTWEPCDNASLGSSCTGFCSQPYQGLGYVTTCNESGVWDVPKPQRPNSAGCSLVACSGLPQAELHGGAVWDPACADGDPSRTLCIAMCPDGVTAAFMSQCMGAAKGWAQAFKLAECPSSESVSSSPSP